MSDGERAHRQAAYDDEWGDPLDFDHMRER
jgi:hypothetical protein